LGAVSRFMSNAFEYGDTLLPQLESTVESVADVGEDDELSRPRVESNQPYLNFAT
jgi:TBC1 domain family member 8/9